MLWREGRLARGGAHVERDGAWSYVGSYGFWPQTGQIRRYEIDIQKDFAYFVGPARAHIGPSGPMWASLRIFPWFPAPIKVLQRVQNSHGHILSTADGKRTSLYLAAARISGRNHAHAICANEHM